MGDLSWRTVAIGTVLGVVFAGTAMYAGIKIGFVDGGNIAAALVAYALLSALGRARPSSHEGNLVQTMSSSAAAMAITSGLLGPVAALSLAGRDISIALVVPWGLALGVLGCLLAIPLRAAFIEQGALPFPSGTATAEIITATYERDGSASAHLKLIGVGAVVAAAIVVARSWLMWIPELWALPLSVGAIPAANIALGVGVSPLLAGVGALAGVRTGIALVLGAVIAWIVIAPQLVDAGIAEPGYLSLLNWLLWAGTGLMLGGTLGSVVGAWRDVRASIRAVRAAGGDGFRTRRVHVIAIGLVAVAVIILGNVAFGVHPIIGVLGIALSFVLCGAAARATGETDNTPAGPLGGFAQIVVGSAAPGGIDAPLVAGGVVNGTLAHSAMLLQNWRTGALLKTPPQPQLVAQLLGVVVGGIACAAAFELIRGGYGLGNDVMPALAARSWQATAEIVQHGTSAMPAYAPLGALVGFVLGIVLAVAQSRVPNVPSPVALGIAFILPPYLSITIAIGALAWWIAVRYRKAWTEEYGLAVASGLIAGEAIAGLVVAGLLVGGLTAS